MPTLCTELEVLISTSVWLVQNGWELEAISIATGTGLPSINSQKSQFRDALKSKNVLFPEALFKNCGPDIVARSNDSIWKLECKGLGKGSPQTLRTNFDRAVASAMSYYDSPGTRIGLALANDYLWVLDFGQRLPCTLREATNLWVFLLENGTIYPYKPTEDLPFPRVA